MMPWLELMKEVLLFGERRDDRTGVGTLALFGRTLKLDCRSEFPAVTTKRLPFGSVASELACLLRGFTELDEYHSVGCHIWDKNAEAFGGRVGRTYGAQWRGWKSVMDLRPENGVSFKTTDQIQVLLDGLRAQPHGRRHLVTAWNPGELDQACLPACHVLFQCYLGEDGLSLAVYMRSCDLFIGLPFDMASYGLMQRLIAKELGVSVSRLTFFLGDAHIYLNHVEQVKTVLARRPTGLRPALYLNPDARLLDFQPKHAGLINYEPWPAVPAPMNP